MKRYMNYGGRSFAAGGAMPMEQLTEFNEGGRHEENGLGGIPQGMNPDGQMNLVEEGETKFDAENYIYSDTLKVDKELAESFNLNPKMVGKTFADASKMAGRKKSKREGDAIEEAANNRDLENLMEAQEAFKQARIEEKLQEIAELDPNALPSLMGQGQPQGGPQGDPAMGGQMQEAPMDEQAMMEQQMMTEQQAGGGQPSPEEMAMMEQQQDMMMGQQEGMMRSGGKLPKEVLKARVQSHMSPAQADAYVKNYGNGGYTTRSYAPGGFMGANPGMMNMANAGAIGMADPCPCGTPGCPPCTGEPNPTGITTQNIDRPQFRKEFDSESIIGGIQFSPNLSYTKEAGFADDRVMQELRRHMLSNYGAAATSGDPAYGTGVSGSTDNGGGDGSSIGGGNDTGGYDSTGNVKDSSNTSKFKEPRRGTSYPIDTSNKWTYLSGVTSSDRRAGKKRYIPKLFQSRKIKTNEFGGNLMQPMNQMRSGGKMCYGCGGAMHNYGGRMDGIQGDPAKYGKWLDIGSKALGVTGNVVGTAVPWAGAAIGGVAGGLGNLSDSAEASANGSVDWKGIDWADMAKDVGVGAASGAMGAAGAGAKLALSTADQLADSLYENKYEKQEAEHLAILNDPNADPDSPEYINAVNKEKERSKNQGAFGIAGQAIGAAGSILSGKIGDVAEDASGAIMDSGIDTIPNEDIIPEMNFSKYGGNLMRKGGGLWANIHAKRARIKAGSGETMRKPGSKGAPTAEDLKKSQNALGGRLYTPGGYMYTDPLYNPNNGISNFKIPQFDFNTNYTTDNEFKNMYPDISEAIEQTPLQQAALYAPIAKNIFDATLAKSDDYNPDFVPAEYVQLDSAQAIQQEKQRNAGLVSAAMAKGINNPSTMLALNHALQGTVSNIQASYDAKNAMLKQTALTSDNTQKKELAKLKQTLKMQTAEAKNLAMNEALSQAKEIAENKTANKLAALYATMGAPDMGKNFMTTNNSKYKKLLKENKKLQKEIDKLNKD